MNRWQETLPWLSGGDRGSHSGLGPGREAKMLVRMATETHSFFLSRVLHVQFPGPCGERASNLYLWAAASKGSEPVASGQGVTGQVEWYQLCGD